MSNLLPVQMLDIFSVVWSHLRTSPCLVAGNICPQLLHVQVSRSRLGFRHQHHAPVLQGTVITHHDSIMKLFLFREL